LLFAAGHGASDLALAFGKAGEKVEDEIALAHFVWPRMGRMGAELEVFGNGEIAKDAAAFGDEGDAQFGKIVGGATENGFAFEGQASAGLGARKAAEHF
jgi:hypothetical protein